MRKSRPRRASSVGSAISATAASISSSISTTTARGESTPRISRSPPSAAVFIKHRPDVDLRLLGPAVKDLVAHSIEGLTPDQVSLTLFEAHGAPAPAAVAAVSPAEAADKRLVLGVLSQRAVVVLLVLMLMAAAALMALPTLLQRRGLDFGTWLKRDVLRR